MNRRIALLGMATVALCGTAAVNARAETFRDDSPRWSGDILDFDRRDLARWQSGSWVRDVHEGRGGWWWVVGDTWYPYPRVDYPYPDPYTPPPFTAPTVIRETGGAPPPRYFYYCESRNNFYPYVVSCEDGWSLALATRPSAR